MPGRMYIAVMVFLAGFFAVLVVVVHQYLLPAMQAAQGVDAAARRQLAAISLLVLAIVLVGVVMLLIVAFRPGRMFLPRRHDPRPRTHYPDAWEEAGRRVDADEPRERRP